jgi:putative cofactor-binding repeat protein
MTATANLTVSATATLDVRALGTDPGNPTHASTTKVGGKVQFENDNYRITVGDDNTVNIHNKNTGEDYQIWGDPHVNVDGQHAFDFWGTTTFALDDGTKVTIQTTPWAHNPNATLASTVTITNGDYGTQITGVDTNTVGDLKFDETRGWGRLLDAAVADGNTIYENSYGKGFVGFDAQGRLRQVDQSFINQTDLTKAGQLQDRFGLAFRALAGLLSISFVGAFLSHLGERSGPTQHHWGGSSRELNLSFKLVLNGGHHHARA